MRSHTRSSERYLNRELSWLQFNRRVLAEAENPANPVLERLRFLAIFESNLDEFFMVRVSGLIEQVESGINEVSPDGLTPKEQLKLIAASAYPLRRRASEVFETLLKPEMQQHGIAIVRIGSLGPKRRALLSDYFRQVVFPLCTPLVLAPATKVPFISNRSLNLAVELNDGAETKLARVKIPSVIPRAIRVSKRRHEYVLLEELISLHLDTLFPGIHINDAYLFRVLRDADVEIRELEASDLISTIEETLRLRRFGDPVLLQHTSEMPATVRQQLMGILALEGEDVLNVDGLLGMEVLHELVGIDRPALRFPPHIPNVPESLATYASLFETIAGEDVLLHHPFDGFRPVEEFVASAANDPQVVGIKQTLYRVGTESPIVEMLAEAAEEGKQVAAQVELKARFDESNNIGWARALEHAGAHVTYGFPELKTHCKMCLIVRREQNGVRSFVHIGTGNYNPSTARQYTDLGLFTCDAEIAQDVSELFNYLTGFSRQTQFRKLLVAPLNLREGILDRIAKEEKLAKKGKSARIAMKLNSLVDPEVIEALYHATAHGVKIDLIVRGTCCLRPQVPDLSANIRVVSIVGRFLEHSRIYYFENDGEPMVLLGSADAMRRNLDRRVEVLVPVENPRLVEHLREAVLKPYLQDNTHSWELKADGTYQKRQPLKSEQPFDVQAWFMANPPSKSLYGSARSHERG
ncbi:MAG: polyphosphate kinase 1 [Fimbriimonas sp.]